MADKVFNFRVDGVDESIKDFSTLSDVIDDSAKSFEGLDADANGAAGALKKVGDSAESAGDDLQETGKKGGSALEGLNVELINSNARMEALQSLTDGVATTFAGATATFVSFAGESPRLQKLNERVGALAQTLGGVVALTKGLEKENRAAVGALIGNFRKAGAAAKAFAFTTRGALAATGIGLLVIALGAVVANFDKIKEAAVRNAAAIQDFIKVTLPALGFLIEGAQKFAKSVGGFRQLFAGAFNAAKTFFQSIGASFAALLKGDIGKIKQIFADFGKEATESFNDGVKESNEKIAEERLKAQLASEIKINDRLIKERQAAGRDTFELEKANIKRRIKLAEAGSEELLDAESELSALILARQKAAGDKRAEQQKAINENIKAEIEKSAAEEVARLEAEEAQKEDIRQRNAEASFSRSQLLRERELQALTALEAQTLLTIEEASNLRLELAADERDRALEDELLTNEERLLILEQFNAAEIDILAERDEQVRSFEAAQVEAKVKAEEEKKAVDVKAKAEQLARDEALIKAQQQLDNERLANARGTVQLIGELAKEGSLLQKAAFAVDKALAISEIIVNLQRELSAIAASNAILGPAAPAVITGLQIQAGIRAALGVAKIGSTFVKAEKGGLLVGPSHKAGGIKGRGSFNNIEVEGGEFIVNKRATKKNMGILNKINSNTFQEGGQLPDFAAITDSLSPLQDFNGQLLDALASIDIKPVVSVEEINKVSSRVVQVKDNATI